MAAAYKIAVFEGDGIGPEIMAPTMRCLTHLAGDKYTLDYEVLPAGAGHYEQTGNALPDTSIDAARASDAILLSAMGLPRVRYPDGTEITPQIDIRLKLDLFAGVRPVRVTEGQPTPLKLDGHEIDFVLIRESTEGLFHTQGCGEVTQDYARETLQITRKTSEDLFRFTFALAEQRKAAGRGTGRVTCVDKANVFRAFAFFREVFDEVAAGHTDMTSDHAYVDAMALWMVEKPWAFDVMVTENMFGDILSDLGAGLMGGLGLAPSADIGHDNAVFQPCHGSAPDIAGKGVANPFAMMLSGAMMLDWLGLRTSNADMVSDGARLDGAVRKVIAKGDVMTRDLGGSAGTDAAAEAVLSAL
ncbi:isocitrate/isopropylmalate dehydrogenase family protein [Cognatishimia sp. MH4019]|uniref:isocitrate/isopropylmalate dehydrogenase family protein n=1 Tax=Cognatishimia sp. MH4019 TaxID=2854030 RepID=UPI001CD4FEBF|nr:isocitrate/isopropylmalate family dehydrogenase [Cognatishimia sp. MH4019]